MGGAPIISCTLALLLTSGCQGNGGAISVRWRIVDVSAGTITDPGGITAADGSCCPCRDRFGKCATTYDVHTGLPNCINTWIIESVSIELADAVTGARIADNLAPFACSLREKTTAFVLPPGTFAISLAARNDVGDGMNIAMPVSLPPPSVRTIIKGDVVNLDLIEIGVNPLPLPHPETGVTF
jgi:hypothetical protein